MPYGRFSSRRGLLCGRIFQVQRFSSAPFLRPAMKQGTAGQVQGRSVVMSQISVNNLTFYYEGSYDNIFEDVTFQIDTDWKLGFRARTGR